MMEKDLVSILVPVYNGEKYVIDFLNSIKKQIYRPIELILRDDCSKDNSFTLCREWRDKNLGYGFSIKIFQGENNLGLSQNIAQLAQQANGRYIFIADQDDVWLENKILRQVEYLKENPQCVICLSDRSIVDDRLNIHIKSNYDYFGYKKTSMKLEEVVKHKYIYAANCMAIRNIDKQIFNIPDGITCHDSFITYMASNYGTIDFLFEPLLLYRVHSNNLSSNFCAENSKSFWECFRRHLRACKRAKKSYENDGRIICAEMMKRYGIDLVELGSPFVNHIEYNYIQTAWKAAKRDYKAGKVGKWKN